MNRSVGAGPQENFKLSLRKLGWYLGRQVERRVSVSTEMYADRVNGRNFRKRSVRDRLGGQVEPAPFTRPVTGKR